MRWFVYLVFYEYGPLANVNGTMGGAVSMKRFLWWGLPGCILVAGAVWLEQNHVMRPIWNNRWPNLIGNASFSIYLVHQTINLALAILYTKTGLLINADLSIGIQCLLALFAGLAFYRWVEKPLLAWINRPGKGTAQSSSAFSQAPAH